MADGPGRAVATANAYRQGDIAGLDDAMTRRLIASTVATESNGGDLAITNRQGYVGRYQAGAGWLADAGYIDKHELAEAMQGQRSEWAWASSGGMTRFLEDSSHWKNDLSLEKYIASSDLQDRAFKINSDHAYYHAIQDGVLKETDDLAKVAGFLKARHIAGYGGAVAAVTGGRVIRDSNGTSNYDYMHDITRNRDGLDQRMYHTPQTPDHAKPSHAPVVRNVFEEGAHGFAIATLQASLAKLGYTDRHGKPLAVDGTFGTNTRYAVERFQHDHHLKADGIAGPMTWTALDQAQARNTNAPRLDHPTHTDHALFQQAQRGVHQMDAERGRTPDQYSDNLAAALTVQARHNNLTCIDQVALSADGERAFAVQRGVLTRHAQVPTVEAVQTSIEQSSAAWQQVMQQRHPAQSVVEPAMQHSLPAQGMGR